MYICYHWGPRLANESPLFSMPRRITPSQFRSQLRQLESRQRQAINRYNQEVSRFNNQLRQQAAANRRAIDEYNRHVRAHNARVRAYRAKLQTELQRFNGYALSPNYSRMGNSAIDLSAAYTHLRQSGTAQSFEPVAQQEVANSVAVVNSFHGYADDERVDPEDLSSSGVNDELAQISGDFNARWRGALFALSPDNPDAARHFCSSSREILSGILDRKAPDKEVLVWDPNCQVTKQGTPTRRSKIRYCLARREVHSAELAEFAETNVKDLNSLLFELNSGTHGKAGRFTMVELRAIKNRVEDAIYFVCQLA